ncbi:30S ribosomal protein S4 [endosymbiont of Sipalinus gigas]|uniref:30S ribosomal protein S4 n=1 Tax=endosymbiont of Sipalinus gigas TaxID=1972134 RepID=UPI000DC70848|nr:30S ribosomal protein S4 [endosymbiont of Sipalinus gigas]BBA85242.1 30S ribosomal protein S4 [endosymbiont of Sipalinus gigas]
MSKYLGPKLKLYKREKIDLYLKSKLIDIKKILNNKNKSDRISDYGNQLREKQKLKRIYCIFERQFLNYYKKSIKKKGNTIENLLFLLESRLDNIIYKIGIGRTILESRQFINHKFIFVNNNIVNIPSYNININDSITISNENIDNIKVLLKKNKNIDNSWFSLNKDKMIFNILNIPININKNINFNLISQLYSK